MRDIVFSMSLLVCLKIYCFRGSFRGNPDTDLDHYRASRDMKNVPDSGSHVMLLSIMETSSYRSWSRTRHAAVCRIGGLQSQTI